MNPEFSQILSALRSRELMDRLGLLAKSIVQSRTEKGIAVDGSSFQPYSAGYAKKRAKLGLPASPVSLQSGDYEGMLEAIDHTVSATLESVELKFSNSSKEQLARYHNTLGAGKSKVVRTFFDINLEEQKILYDTVDHELTLIMRSL